MLRGVEVLGGVLAGRVVAAPDVPADHAEPEVDPWGADLQALLAALAAGTDFARETRMRAAFHGAFSHRGGFLLIAGREHNPGEYVQARRHAAMSIDPRVCLGQLVCVRTLR